MEPDDKNEVVVSFLPTIRENIVEELYKWYMSYFKADSDTCQIYPMLGTPAEMNPDGISINMKCDRLEISETTNERLELSGESEPVEDLHSNGEQG